MKQQIVKKILDLENEQKKIKSFKTNDHSEITDIYNKYREPFFLYIKKRFSLKEDFIYDVYHDCFRTLYDNVNNGKLTQLTCSFKTYLFKIGTNTMNKYYEKDKRIVAKDSLDIYDLDDDPSDIEWLEKKDIVWKAINELEDPCHTILSFCYWEHKSMVEIAAKMNYKSEQYARNKKSLCRKYLIEKLKKIFALDK